MSKQASSRWFRLAAGVILLVFAGVIYAWSILKAPFGEAFGWSNSQLGLNFTLTMGFFCIGGILGSILLKRCSPRIAVILGGILCFLGFFLTARNQGSIAMLYLAYGVLSGCGIGIVYNVTISTVGSWFPDKRTTASGCLMMGFGTSSLILGALLQYLFSTVGWRTAYTILGISVLVILFIGSFFMAPAPAAAAVTANESVKNYRPSEMMRTGNFWLFYFLTIVTSAVGTCVISFAKDVALSVGAAEGFAVFLVGALSVCNGISRLIFGWLFDAIGRRKTMLLASFVAIAAVLLMLGATTLHAVPLMVVGIVAVGASYGAMPTLSSGFVSSMYGPGFFSTNFSIANTMLVFSSFSSTIAGMILGSSGNYTPVFLLLLLCAVIGLVLNLLIQQKTRIRQGSVTLDLDTDPQ